MPTDNNDLDMMVNHISDLNARERFAEKIIDELREYVDTVGPVESLVQLVEDYKGANVYDKIRDYFRVGGKPIEFYEIINEQKAKYYVSQYKNNNKSNMNNLVKNSVKTHGAEPKKTIKKRKEVSKNNYKKLLAAFLSTAIIIGSTIGSLVILDKTLRNKDYEKSVDTVEQAYIVDTMNRYDEGLETIDITDLGEVDAEDFCTFLEENSFEKFEIIYLTKRICGKENADKVCYEYGYHNYDKFLSSYFPGRVMSSSGETVIQKYGDERQLANYVEESIKKKSTNLNALIESYKTGIGRKIQ